MKHTTDWREYDDGRIRAEYGFDNPQPGDPAGYFAATATGQRRSRRHGWTTDCGGMMHDAVREHFPELAPMLKWHLCSKVSGPMHYVANAQYWARMVHGVGEYASRYNRAPDPVDAFKSTVVFGAVEGDELPWEGWCQMQHDGDCAECDTLRAAVAELAEELGTCTGLSDAARLIRRVALDKRVEQWCHARFVPLQRAFAADWAACPRGAAPEQGP
jgi:hypothetical protein